MKRGRGRPRGKLEVEKARNNKLLTWSAPVSYKKNYVDSVLAIEINEI